VLPEQAVREISAAAGKPAFSRLIPTPVPKLLISRS